MSGPLSQQRHIPQSLSTLNDNRAYFRGDGNIVTIDKKNITARIIRSPAFFAPSSFILIVALEFGARALALTDPLIIAAAPAAGVALMAILRLHRLGLPLVFLAYLVSGYLLSGELTLWSPAAHALGATVGAYAMRAAHHRELLGSNIREWTSFALLGAGVTALVITCLLVFGQLLSGADFTWVLFTQTSIHFLSLALGVLMSGAVLASLKEFKLGGHHVWIGGLRAAASMALVAVILILSLMLVSDDGDADVFLLLCLPSALWIARRPNSLPGALIGFVGGYLGLWIIKEHFGSIAHPQTLQTVMILLVIVAVAQAFHALELDRRVMVNDVLRHRDALEDMVRLRTLELERLIRQSAGETSAQKQFRARMKNDVSAPLAELKASLNQATRLDSKDAKLALKAGVKQLTALEATIRTIVLTPK